MPDLGVEWPDLSQPEPALPPPGTPLVLPPAWYLLADPGVHVPTAALFQTPDLTRDSAPATISDFVSGTVLGNGAPLGNVFEPVLRR